MINVRIRKLEEESQAALQKFVEDLEHSPAAVRRPTAVRA
jgi:hypothetical protein